MDNQELDKVELEGLTLGEIEAGANAAIERLKDNPRWDKLSPLTQRALFYYEAYTDGAATSIGKVYKRAWLDGWRYALADMRRVLERVLAGEDKRDAAEIVAELEANPAPINIPDDI